MRRYLFLLGGICLVTVTGFVAAGQFQQCDPVPSPWYIGENIQYFPPGPEFKLSREAAALKAYKADIEAQQAGQ